MKTLTVSTCQNCGDIVWLRLPQDDDDLGVKPLWIHILGNQSRCKVQYATPVIEQDVEL